MGEFLNKGLEAIGELWEGAEQLYEAGQEAVQVTQRILYQSALPILYEGVKCLDPSGCMKAFLDDNPDLPDCPSCTVTIPETCLKFEEKLSYERKKGPLSLTGEVGIYSGMTASFDIEKGLITTQFTTRFDTLSAKLLGSIENSGIPVGAEYEWSLSDPVTVFRKLFFAGPAPILIEIKVEPMFWVTMQKFTSAELQISQNEVTSLTGSFNVNIYNGK